MPTIERIFDLVEAGCTFGDVARTLNAERVAGRRGNPWTARTVRTIVHNRAFAGEKGYPRIIDRERFDAIHAALTRLDSVQVAKRKGGRKPADDSFFLRGLLFCAQCGGAMYTRRQAVGRVYVCRERRQCTGLCNAPAVPAELIESHVLRHLDTFVGSVESWIAERLDERNSERKQREAAVVRARAKLTDLDRQRERHLAEYRSLVDEGKTTAPIALEEVERIDREREHQQQAIAQLEAVVSEWAGPPDVDAALDFYSGLVELVQGRIQKADGAGELHAALSTVLAGLWAEIEQDRERLLVEFQLLTGDDAVLPDGQPVPAMFKRQRPTLPPRLLDDRLPPEPLAEQGPTPSYTTSP